MLQLKIYDSSPHDTLLVLAQCGTQCVPQVFTRGGLRGPLRGDSGLDELQMNVGPMPKALGYLTLSRGTEDDYRQ